MSQLVELVGGPKDGKQLNLVSFRPCIEYLVSAHHPIIYIADNGAVAPNNIGVMFHRYVYDYARRKWIYTGKYEQSYYE